MALDHDHRCFSAGPTLPRPASIVQDERPRVLGVGLFAAGGCDHLATGHTDSVRTRKVRAVLVDPARRLPVNLKPLHPE